jgi:hypothetical protein
MSAVLVHVACFAVGYVVGYVSGVLLQGDTP